MKSSQEPMILLFHEVKVITIPLDVINVSENFILVVELLRVCKAIHDYILLQCITGNFLNFTNFISYGVNRHMKYKA